MATELSDDEAIGKLAASNAPGMLETLEGSRFSGLNDNRVF
jgi:hypothetical protein